ncbi:hypothetical protein BpHYR1_008645 [Brachionus plicatilis]|uniref:Uncharacterized protein n=1 Tax=Brachionus plicatilis TaxID=10195 RepID=A0A3M7TA87_BRAPC|nr:hypothetical protein BpHYR1_008645 [Brachionus plicatilis]
MKFAERYYYTIIKKPSMVNDMCLTIKKAELQEIQLTPSYKLRKELKTKVIVFMRNQNKFQPTSDYARVVALNLLYLHVSFNLLRQNNSI